MMQSILIIVCIILNIVLNLQAAVISKENPQNLIDKLLEYSNAKCPYLKTTKLLESKYLSSCPDYTKIKSITTLDPRTVYYDISCLFYYNNFVLLCDNVSKYNVNITSSINDTTLDKVLKSYTLVHTCTNLQNIELISDFKNATSLSQIMKNNITCAKICTDAINSTLTPICSLAAYSANLTRRIKIESQRIQAPSVAAKTPKESAKKNETLEPVKKPNLVENTDHLVDTAQNNAVQQQTQHELPQTASETLPETVKTSQTVAKESTENRKESNGSKQADEKHVPSETKPADNVEKPPSTDDQNGKPVDTAVINPPKEEDHPVKESKENIQIEQPQDEIKLPANSDANTVGDVVQDTKPGENPPVEYNPEDPQDTDAQMNQSPNNEEGADDGPADILEDSEPAEPIIKDAEKVKLNTKPQETDEDVMIPAYNNSNTDEEDSFFFIYFMMVCAVFILGYIGYHNKQKVLALVIEGRRGRRGSRRGRPNSANYHKLDSNLEEAITSSCNKTNTTNIIY